VRPGRELDPDNLLTLCRACHFVFGHVWSWASWNTEVRGDCNQWRHKRAMRPDGRAEG
jgi:hypothetical protein